MTDRYRIRTPETWDRAREAYLAGEPAESVCVRFDLGLRTFRARAAAEGWRRGDQPDPGPDQRLAGEDDPADLDDHELRHLARTRMARAARQGLVGEALRWARFEAVVARLAETKAREAADRATRARREGRADARDSTDLLRDVAASARSIEVQARAVLGVDRATSAVQSRDLHDLHDLHPVSPDTRPDGETTPPRNRADRRRLLKSGRKRR